MDTLERRLGGVKVRGCSDGLVLTWRDQKHGDISVCGVGNEPTVLEVLVASVAILLA